MPWPGRIRWHEISADREDELAAKGHRRRSFFPHRAVFLPRAGPDGARLAQWMCGREPAASTLWEVVLFADAEAAAEFPRELFFDDDLVWHRQHFGREAHIAYADVVVDGADMWTMSHVSDLVQRIGRRREHKTRIEKRFKGWPDMLLNALLAFAADRGVRRLRITSAKLQMRNTDPKRTVQPELFERVYDRCTQRLLRATRDGDWWLVDVVANKDRLAVPSVRDEPLPSEPVICVCHDVEAGLGHVETDALLATRANVTWRESVAATLGRERETGITATYNVAGRLLEDVRPEIEGDGHCIAFHSFDHKVERDGRIPRAVRRVLKHPQGARLAGVAGGVDQLAACRTIDYRIKGYRAPQSRITRELADRNLQFHNFEWLASSERSLKVARPTMRNGIVRIPVHLDDFDLYRGRVDLAGWKARARTAIAQHEVAVLSLHDVYAHLWLDRYAELLEELRTLRELRTLDEIAADIALASSV